MQYLMVGADSHYVDILKRCMTEDDVGYPYRGNEHSRRSGAQRKLE